MGGTLGRMGQIAGVSEAIQYLFYTFSPELSQSERLPACPYFAFRGKKLSTAAFLARTNLAPWPPIGG